MISWMLLFLVASYYELITCINIFFYVNAGSKIAVLSGDAFFGQQSLRREHYAGADKGIEAANNYWRAKDYCHDLGDQWRPCSAGD